MRRYETIIILDPDLSDPRAEYALEDPHRLPRRGIDATARRAAVDSRRGDQLGRAALLLRYLLPVHDLPVRGDRLRRREDRTPVRRSAPAGAGGRELPIGGAVGSRGNGRGLAG